MTQLNDPNPGGSRMRVARKVGPAIAVLAFVTTITAVPVRAEESTTPEAQWHAAIVEIMNRDGVDEATANTRLANLLVWHDAVSTIMARDGLTFTQAARNLARFLAAAEVSKGVDRWHDLFLAAGWSEAHWAKGRCVIERESGGNPNARSRTRDTGLMQINDVNIGYLKRQGIISSGADLYDPLTNLRAGWALYQEAGGWGPWVGGRRC